MSSQVISPFHVFTGRDGEPLEAGFIYIGAVNQNAQAVPIQVYWDEDLTIPAVQPIRTLGGYPSRSGTPAIVYVRESDYSITVRDKNETLVFSSLSATTLAGFAVDLANEEDPSKGGALIGRSDQMVDSVADLRLLLKTSASKFASTLGYYEPGDGGHADFYLDVDDTTTADNGGSVIVAADGGRWKISNPENIDVRQFGCKGDGVTSNTSQLAAIRTHAALRTEAGNTVRINFPAGRYLYSQSPNWAILRLHMNFEGEVWLVNDGAGASFILDGGATGTGIYGIQITGMPLIYGEVGSMQGVFMRAIYKSWVAFNVRSVDPAFAALYMEWCVSNVIRFTCNANEGGLVSVPARGIHATIRGAAEETSYNLFENVECTGMPVGIYLDGALGNMFVGGAVQGCTNVGMQQTANAWENKFYGTDFEVNTVRDAEIASREAQFYGCDFHKTVVFQSGAVNCSVIGGAMEGITVESGALRTLYSGVTYNRFGTGVISDAGTQTRFRDIRNKGTGEISNVPRAKTAIVVGASPFTYTNSSGNQQTVLVTGGTVSQVAFVRFIGESVPTSGFLELSPGDSVTVTYTVAPGMFLYTR